MLGETEDKLLHPIGRSNAFCLSVGSFLQAKEVKKMVIVYKNTTQLSKLKNYLSLEQKKAIPLTNIDFFWAQGGKERQDSVWAGLESMPEEVTHVLVHDCARPCIRPHTISEAAREVAKDRAITVARPLKDTLRLREDRSTIALHPSPTRTLDRSNYWLMETPQGAPKTWLQDGLKKARKENLQLTDDMAAVELMGQPVGMLEPGYPNPKITTPDDFSLAEFLLKS